MLTHYMGTQWRPFRHTALKCREYRRFPPELRFKTLYAEEQVDFKHIEKTDLARLSQKIRDSINSRAGAVVAEDVFIQELHYMSKSDASPEGQLRK